MERPRVKNERILLERIEKFISPLYFADVNLHNKLYVHTVKIPSLFHYHAPGRITYAEAMDANCYVEVLVGKSFGPTWSTHWFKLDIDLSINQNWVGNEVRLRWNSNSEAMVWENGVPKQGLTGDEGKRIDYILTKSCQGTEKLTLSIEMACNGLFGAGKDGMINTPDPKRSFTLSQVEISVLDKNIYRITQDLKLIIDMVKELPKESDFKQKALQTGCDVVNCFQPEKSDSKERAISILDCFFKSSDGEERNSYRVHAMGHCHIDTAWLWPYDETRRKCARSWSSALELMSRFPDFKFVCSQAVQLSWMKEDYPVLYRSIKEYAKRGQFLPTGGSWVEMDGNIPSGESFMRQFIYGQQFFKEEFGSYCDVFWLPDTFGYSAQLPQIAKQCGIKYFLTQKISWSLINTFPHNSFVWQGIDGSKLLTHFPPADTYESSVSVKDVLKTKTNNKDKGIVSDGILLYGFGDGGGGPTEDMIYNVERLASLPELPKIQHSTPSRFFESLKESEGKLHTWVGELYLELHQGTFTSQAFLKKNNRYFEQLLFNVEFLQVFAIRRFIDDSRRLKEILSYQSKIDEAWKKLLLNQFHDVLPGTSIKLVNDDADKLFKEIDESLQEITKHHLEMMFTRSSSQSEDQKKMVINTNAYVREEVVSDDGVLKLVNVPGMSFSDLERCTVDEFSSPIATKNDDTFTLQNEHIKATFNKSGQLISCILVKNGRECILPNNVGNGFILYTDIPLFWDAWDVMPYNNETADVLQECTEIEIFNDGELRVGIKFTLKISEVSILQQTISLDAFSNILRFDTKVSWHENRKMLKVRFPLNVHTDHATYDIQCGHIKRPNHTNTSWDWAKHEVCGHKWVDLSEYNFGVALLNDCKYGYSTYGNVLEMSLLRSPKAPDDQADMGWHTFSYGLMPHTGTFQSAGVIHEAHSFNNPMKMDYYDKAIAIDSVPLLTVGNDAIKLLAIKSHHKNERDVVIRMFESFGSHVDALLTSVYNFKDIKRISPLEDELLTTDDENDTCIVILDENNATFKMKPFEILTLLIQF